MAVAEMHQPVPSLRDAQMIQQPKAHQLEQTQLQPVQRMWLSDKVLVPVLQANKVQSTHAP